ncbi:Protein of unknown function [Gryllus bimaculatus]|nr:Protein of unknown function [Gryllus bimaculatus]
MTNLPDCLSQSKPMPEVIMNLWDKRDVPKENHCLSLNQEGRIEAESCEAGHAYACQVTLVKRTLS